MKKMYVFLLSAVFLFGIPGEFLHAARQKNVPQHLTQPDGTVLNCFASGDEFYNWLHDANQFTIIQDRETGYYVYARKAQGRLLATRLVPGIDDPASGGLIPSLNLDADQVKELGKTRFAIPELKGGFKSAAVGTLNSITVFIRFSDQSAFAESSAGYEASFNGTGAVSVRDYYQNVSSNQLTFNTLFYPSQSGGAVVSYQDANPRNYFRAYNAVSNPVGYQGDDQAREREHGLLSRAVDYVRASAEASGINFDYNNDGSIDNITFIVKGANEGWNSLLWPHRWALYTLDSRINNLRVYSYIFILSDGFTVSTTCHEVSHTLGAPDLYHYTNDENSPVGSWDLMEWNESPPQQMGAYIKYKYFGWFSSIQQITNAGTYSLNPLNTSPFSCYKIASPNSQTEFFLVEYRKKEGRYESSLPGSGLIVYRINSSITGNSDGPPDEVYAYRPGGTTSSNGDISQANYSAESGRTAINSGTSPSPFLANGAAGGLNLTNISSAGSSISFTVSFAASGPDLVITLPSTTPASGSAGSKIDIACRLTNQGTATAAASTLRVYLSTNQTYESGDVNLANGAMGTLDPGAYFNVSGSGITIPANVTAGNYYVLYVADADRVVSETDETNNLGYCSFTVTGANVFNPPRSLAAVVTGSSVALTWAAPLAGSSGTLSGYKIFRAATLITTITNPALLTYTDTGLAAGSYTYYATATYTSVAGESGASNQVTATVAASGQPDLTITNQTITPLSLFAGATIDIACRLSNIGTATAGASTIRVYLSINTTYEPSDVLLAYGDLAAVNAATYIPVTGTGITIPGTTLAGNYYVLFQADATGAVPESNENNNISFSTLTVNGANVFNPPLNLTAGVTGTSVALGWSAPLAGSSGTLSGFKVYRDGVAITTITNPATRNYTNSGLAAGTYGFHVTATYTSVNGESGASNLVSATITIVVLPDLTITLPVVTPAALLPGEAIGISCRLVNQGSGLAGASVIRVFLSINTSYDSGDVLLAYGNMDAIAAGSYLSVTGDGITIPGTVTPGSYYVLFVADASGVVAESNETNNENAAPITIRNPAVFNPPTGLRADISGNDVTLTWNPPAAGSSGTLSGFKVYQNSSLISTIFTGSEMHYSITGLAIGSYSFYVVATYVSVAGESAPSNQVAVTISVINRPDLVITNQVSAPATVNRGETINVSCHLLNQGTAMAGASTLRLYLSSNQTFEAGDVALAFGNMETLNAGYYIEITGDGITIPRLTPPGNYYILFLADADGGVAESNENNNISRSPLTVTIGLGIGEELVAGNLKIYPVPASDHLMISYSGLYNEKCRVAICSITGSVVHSEEIVVREGLVHSMDVRFWPNGYYFVRFTTDKETFTQQVIVAH